MGIIKPILKIIGLLFVIGYIMSALWNYTLGQVLFEVNFVLVSIALIIYDSYNIIQELNDLDEFL